MIRLFLKRDLLLLRSKRVMTDNRFSYQGFSNKRRNSPPQLKAEKGEENKGKQQHLGLVMSTPYQKRKARKLNHKCVNANQPLIEEIFLTQRTQKKKMSNNRSTWQSTINAHDTTNVEGILHKTQSWKLQKLLMEQISNLHKRPKPPTP